MDGRPVPPPPRVPSLLLAVQANHYLEYAGQVPFFLGPVKLARPKKGARISLGQRKNRQGVSIRKD